MEKPAMKADLRWCRAILAGIAATLLGSACGTSQAGGAAEPEAAEIVRVWPSAAPGTSGWTGPEVELDAELPVAGKTHIITNVTVPTLTIFRPKSGGAGRTAMLVVPGGAFRALAWDLDGTEVAHWLAAHGITAFLLKYRVRPPGDSAPTGPESFDDFLLRTQAARQFAAADAEQALQLIRANSAKYGVAADRVGMIGFSAGAITVMGAALSSDAAARPDFAVSVYGALPADQQPAAGAPPLFVVAAQDDPQVPWRKSVEIYERWSRAGRPAELHLYEKGGHGFGMRRHNLPADKWPQALEARLLSRGLGGPNRTGA
jgi:acetyl esterase/lipase